MRGSFLFKTILTKADLSGADLSGARLDGPHLSGADLSGTDLSEARLIEVNLSEALNLTEDQVIKARTLYKCRLPKNIDVAKLKKEKPELFRN